MNYKIIFFIIFNLANGYKLCYCQKIKTELIIVKGKVLSDTIYIVKGQNPPSDKNKWEIIDSSIANKNGIIKFNFKTNELCYYRVFFGTNISKLMVLGFNEKITLYANDNEIYFTKINGSAENRILTRVLKINANSFSKMNNYADSAEFHFNDSLKYRYFAELNELTVKNIRKTHVDLIKKYPKSFVAITYLTDYVDSFDTKQIRSILRNYPYSRLSKLYVENIKYKLLQKKELKISNNLFDFTFKDTANNSINLLRYSDKFVLVDFWASWCVPCIKNITYLDSILNEYNSHEIIYCAISFDIDIKNWKKGIPHYKKRWIHISDLNGFEGNTAKFYNIKSIPRYMLFNKEKKILVDNVDIKKLDSLFANMRIKKISF